MSDQRLVHVYEVVFGVLFNVSCLRRGVAWYVRVYHEIP